MVLRAFHAALKKSNIVPNLIRTPDDLGLVQGGPTHDDIGLGHPRVSFTSPKSRGGNITFELRSYVSNISKENLSLNHPAPSPNNPNVESAPFFPASELSI